MVRFALEVRGEIMELVERGTMTNQCGRLVSGPLQALPGGKAHVPGAGGIGRVPLRVCAEVVAVAKLAEGSVLPRMRPRVVEADRRNAPVGGPNPKGSACKGDPKK